MSRQSADAISGEALADCANLVRAQLTGDLVAGALKLRGEKLAAADELEQGSSTP